MASVVLLALHRLSTLLVARYQFFRWACLRYCRDGFVSFYGAEFRRDFATCKIRQGADSPCMRLAKFSGELYLEFYCYKIFKA